MMTDPGYRHYVLIIDRSGSMVTIAAETQNGVRLFVDEQKKIPGKATLSLYQFDHAVDRIHGFIPLDAVGSYTLQPRGNTALLDACGLAITQVGEKLDAMPEGKRPGKVVVLIATDGQENFSREYKLSQIRDMITRQHDVYGWEFMYVGANQDSFAEAGNMGIAAHATMDYAETPVGTRNAWAGASASSARYASGQSDGVSYTDEERAKAAKKD